MSSTTWELMITALERDNSAWELFQENSKATPHDPFMPEALAAAYAKQMPESLSFHPYPEVKLPEAAALPSVPLQQAIARRTAATGLEPGEFSFENAAALLRYSYGIAGDAEPPEPSRRRRAVHSPGSLFPVELFIHSSRVQGLNSGIYHYNPPENSLRLLRGGDHSQKLAPGLQDGRLAQTAALMVFIAVMPERSVIRYGDRGYRFALLEAGAVVQNLNLVSAALGLACVNIGEYFDREIDDVLTLDGLTMSTVYAVAVGKPEKETEEAVHGGRTAGEANQTTKENPINGRH